MDAKEKAKELFKKYSIKVKVSYTEDSIPNIKHAEMCKISSKKCALIAVDEIVASKPIGNSLEFWNEVKQEIEKL